ncbi:glycosyltransferase [Bifidobacterium aquikefiri]|uniref:Glycosyl transferase family protein n=1 Tax=Bifidobacterium aquikefiri TaxID=1653207 RepID=A0A261G7Z7_9BIFI|nr:glycosyltransferase [Bifidobacterium aquikefiri]OZG67559.1 glycosyl transferase family protein [Bifidobacterium aquikefiri]
MFETTNTKNDFPLTIVIPARGTSSTLSRLFVSIEREAVKTNVLVVDDNYSEYEKSELAKTVASFAKKSLNNTYRVIPNYGKYAGGARNTGINATTTKWLLFADGDDFFSHGWYKCVAQYFCSPFDVVFFGSTSFNESTGMLGQRHRRYAWAVKKYEDKKSVRNELRLRYDFPVPWCKLMKTSLIKNTHIKFDEIIANEDVNFSLELGKNANSIMADKTCIYVVTESKSSSMQQVDYERSKARISVALKAQDFLINETDYRHCHISIFYWYLLAIKSGLTHDELSNLREFIKSNNASLFSKNILLCCKQILQLAIVKLNNAVHRH